MLNVDERLPFLKRYRILVKRACRPNGLFIILVLRILAVARFPVPVMKIPRSFRTTAANLAPRFLILVLFFLAKHARCFVVQDPAGGSVTPDTHAPMAARAR